MRSHAHAGFEPCAVAGRSAVRRAGFTLIELLVVMAIISVLASMILPSLSRAKERARVATCINNLRQMGISLKLYTDDHRLVLPPNRAMDANDRLVKDTRAALGGHDPLPRLAMYYLPARQRPLYGYMQPSDVYRCPRDKGQRILHCQSRPLKPSNFETVGCSYQYNAGGLTLIAGGGFRETPEDAENGIALKQESWVPNPSLYLLMHEPPARLYGCSDAGPEWYQWHFVQGPSDLSDPKRARQEFISPVLFVDGHTATHNFSKALATDPYYPYEPTRDWVWYKPRNPR